MFLNWVKKWQTLIKLVLFISIASLVIVEIIRLFKTISFDKIEEILLLICLQWIVVKLDKNIVPIIYTSNLLLQQFFYF